MRPTLSGKRRHSSGEWADIGADMNLVTQGNKQSVTIKSQDEKAEVRGATITLQRG
jgi:hypothetical protein